MIDVWPRDADQRLFAQCVAASLAVHMILLVLGRGFHWNGPPPIEIDLTMTSPIPGTGPAKLGAPKRLVPNASKTIPLPARDAQSIPTVAPVQSPKDWVLPDAGAKPKPQPAPQADVPVIPNAPQVSKPQAQNPATPGGAADGTGTSPLPEGSGRGADYGTPNGTGDGGSPVSVMPRLLNLDELLRNLRKYYPEAERRAGHEGHVLLAVHIGADGGVTDSEVLFSAGAAFDEAARKVAKLMRFSPAQGPSGPVPVRVRQRIDFQLEN